MDRQPREELLSKKTSWAFLQINKDPSNKDGILEIVNCYIERRLCATELIRRSIGRNQRPLAERASIDNFFETLTCIEEDHGAMKAPLESEVERLRRKVRNLTYLQNFCSRQLLCSSLPKVSVTPGPSWWLR